MTDRADIVTGEIVHFAPGRLSPAETAERTAWLREVTKAALVEHVDYGIIPGTDRPSLLKPGAEMLLLAAGLGFTITRVEVDLDATGARLGVTYRATVRRGELMIIAECDGYAGYDETRYYRSAEDSERLERSRAKHDRRPPRPERYIEYRAPWNTLGKMAQKRALVGAALNAVAGSGLFAQSDDPDDRTPPPPPPDDPGQPF